MHSNSESIAKAINVLGEADKAYQYLDTLAGGDRFRAVVQDVKVKIMSDIISKIADVGRKTQSDGSDISKNLIGREYDIVYELDTTNPSGDQLSIKSLSKKLNFSVPVDELAIANKKDLWDFTCKSLRCIYDYSKNERVELSGPMIIALQLEREDIESFGSIDLAESLATAAEIIARVGEKTIDHDTKAYESMRFRTNMVTECVKAGKEKGLYEIPKSEKSENESEFEKQNTQLKKAIGELDKAAITLGGLSIGPKPGETNRVEKMDYGTTREERLISAIFGCKKTILLPITAYDEVRDAEAQAITKIFERIRNEGFHEKDSGTRPIQAILGEGWRIYATRDDANIDGEHLVFERPDGQKAADVSLRELVFADNVKTCNFISNDLRDIRINSGEIVRLDKSLYEKSMMTDEELDAAFKDGSWEAINIANSILSDVLRIGLVGDDVVKYEWTQTYVDHFNDKLLESGVLDQALEKAESERTEPSDNKDNIAKEHNSQTDEEPVY